MNDMNLFVMSYSDIINWYKPQTESEEYILTIMKKNVIPNVEDLDDKIEELESENEKLLDENSGLASDIDRLSRDISNLESEISNLEWERES